MNRRPLKVLVAYSMWSTHSSTIMEYMSALERYTDFQVSYVHATNDAEMDFDFNEFDVVFQNHCIRLCFDGHASLSYQQALKSFKGLKVIAVQDDYDRTFKLHQSIRELGIHVVLTCIQRRFWPVVYPASELPGVALVQGLTGYVPETLNALQASYLPLSERKIVVGYRGRDLGARYGRLASEKYEIGRRMIEICTERGIAHDIAMDEASRIYGDDWYRFLGNCRVVLGSESGSNVFDFDGSIEDAYNRLTHRLGRRPTHEEFLPYIADVEKCFDVGQISPRVFECAAVRTPMVLFRGRYSDVLEPELHYVPLEKDFSNIEQVLRCIEDISALESMAERTYRHLVLSGSYGYRQFATGLKTEIETQFELLRKRSKSPVAWAPATLANDTADSADWSARTSASSSVLAERPTREPQSLQDAQRKQMRFKLEQKRLQLEHFGQTFAEMQSFYSNAVIACLQEAQRIAAYHTDADVLRSDSSPLHGGIVPQHSWSSGLAQLATLKAEVERELVSVTSQRDALRETRRAAEASGDQIEVDASFVRELDILRQYFDVGPRLYQQFAETYEHTREILIKSLENVSSEESVPKKMIDLRTRVVMLTINDWRVDSRVTREAEALARNGIEVEVIFRRAVEEPLIEERNGVRYLCVPKTTFGDRDAKEAFGIHLRVLKADAVRLLTGPDRFSACESTMHLLLLPLLALPVGVLWFVRKLFAWQQRSFAGLPFRRKLAPYLNHLATRCYIRAHQFKAFATEPLLYLVEYAVSCKRLLDERAPDVVHAHDLATLSCAFAACQGVPSRRFVYDAHELETHTNYTLNAWTSYWVRRYESALIKQADGVVTVCESIAGWLAKTYRIRLPTVVMNVPTSLVGDMAGNQSPCKSTVRQLLKLSPQTPLFIYVGSVTIDRGLERCVEALKYLPDAHFALVGPRYSVIEKELLRIAVAMQVEDRLHLVDAVDSGNVVSFISDADCSVIAVQNTCLTYYFCLPNKLFESVMAGLPVAVSRLVELERFVNENSVGLIMDETDPKDIARAIDQIICNPDHFRFSKAKVHDISQRYGWDVQEQRLLKLYKQFSPDATFEIVAAA